MTQPNADLARAFASASALPEAAQQALAHEIADRVEELAASCLTPAQRDEVRRRLAEPARYADPKQVRTFFAQHGIGA